MGTDMTALEREYLTLWIANDLSARLVQEMPEQSEALKALTAEIECACARWLNGSIRSTDITQLHQRTRALLKTIRFLEELTCPGDTPRVPAHIRDTARRLLRHYPGLLDIELAHKALPEVYGPVPTFSRSHGKTVITALGLDKIGSKE